MRLYLSSNRFGNDPAALRKLAPKGRVGLIMNALDDRPDTRGNWRTSQMVNLIGMGFQVAEIDLTDYFDRPGDLEELLETFDMVWVVGGNCFILKRAMEKSGFDSIVVRMLDEDKVVYAGFDAGALVTAPTMRGLEHYHDPLKVPKGYPTVTPENGLGIVPFSLAVHYQSETVESRSTDSAVAYFQNEGIPFETLRDGQAFVVNGDLSTIMIAG